MFCVGGKKWVGVGGGRRGAGCLVVVSVLRVRYENYEWPEQRAPSKQQ